MNIGEIRTRKEEQTFDCKNIGYTIVAFANPNGGTIAIEVSDKTRKVGVDQYTEKLNELLRVPLDFFSLFVLLITSDLLPCIDNDG